MQNTKGMSLVSGGSVLLALLQSLCTAALTINRFRFGIGLTAAAAASFGPLIPLHRSGFRLPMIVIALVGAVINLVLLAWIWHLRSQPAAQWRQQPPTKKQKRSERLQLILSLLTLVLVAVEETIHLRWHHHL